MNDKKIGQISSVYDLDCNSVNELIYLLLNKTNELINYADSNDLMIKNKVSYEDLHNKYKLLQDGSTANYTGKWFGLDKPTLSQEGVSSQVEKNTHDILELNNKYSDLKDLTGKFCSLSCTSFPHFKLENREGLINVFSRQNIDLTYCDMVNVSSLTDSNITYDIPAFEKSIKTLAENGLKTIMIKPHIGVNNSDDTGRPTYKPNNLDLFFRNWTKCMMDYGKICVDNNIPILCISVEMDWLCEDDKSIYWSTLYNTLKAGYPNLLIAHSFYTGFYGSSLDREVYKYCDLIGLNVYLSLIDKASNELNLHIVNPLISGDLWDLKPCDCVSYLSSKYNKKIFITETGCIDTIYGLYDTDTSKAKDNHYSQYLYMSMLKNGLFSMKEVIGFALWHTEEPWAYFEYNSITDAETVITDYIKGVVKL